MLSFHKILIVLLVNYLFFYSVSIFSQQLPADPTSKAINQQFTAQTSDNETTANSSEQNSDNEAVNDSDQYKYYDIEIILFKHNNSSDLKSEFWNVVDNINTDYAENSILDTQIETEIETNNTNKIILENPLAKFIVNSKHFISLNKLVTPIAAEQFILTKQAEHIKYSKDYRLLTHLAWRQPGYSKEEAQPLRFIFSQKKNDFTGEIKIILSRYLHAEVNFNLIEEVCRTVERAANQEVSEEKTDSKANDKVKIEVQLDQQPNVQAKTSMEAKQSTKETVCRNENIQFKQSRKMRSKQLHYIDHPVFGLLIQINPSEIKSELPIEQAKP